MTRKAYVAWNSALDLGFHDIDEQHRGLIQLINDLWQTLMSRQSRETHIGIVQRLEHYTIEHFAAEEQMMADHGFPGLMAHKSSHHYFATQVAAVRQRLEQNQNVGLDLLRFLTDWLTYHISVVDRQYADFIRAQETGHPGENPE